MTDVLGGNAEGYGSQEFLEILAARVAANPRFKQAATKAERARLRRELGFSSAVPSLKTARRLIESAAILAASQRGVLRQLAYRTAINIYGLLDRNELSAAAGLRVVLTRLGNFAALEAENDVANTAAALPLPMMLEEIASVESRSVTIATRQLIFTDFQLDLWTQSSAQRDAAISAPTSAGKSFVLQNFLYSRFVNRLGLAVVYLVPTRALISQVAEDLEDAVSELKGERPRVISVPPNDTRPLPDRAIYVFTPERLQLLLERHPDFAPEIIIVDEAHLLAEGSRGVLLQWIVTKLLGCDPKPQILFASPTISNLEIFGRVFDLPHISKIRSVESTVAQNFLKVKVVDLRHGRLDLVTMGDGRRSESEIGSLTLQVPLFKRYHKLAHIPVVLGRGQLNIVYVNGADEAERVALEIASLRENVTPSAAHLALAQAAREAVHPSYALVECLCRGVAYHYSHMPATLRSQIEHAFGSRDVEFMVCTSTLLQGINSPAHNIFMYCPEKGAGRPLGSVDFWNLAGRAGRLGREFQGNIFLIDYGSWRSQPLAGARETTIASALGASLADPTDLISVITERPEDKPRHRLDLESSFTKLLVDHRTGQLDQTFYRVGVGADSRTAKAVRRALEGVEGRITLPDYILQQSPNVSPHKQQRLYDYICKQIKTNRSTAELRLSPRHPWANGAYPSYRRILKLCYRLVWNRPEHSKLHRFHALLALWWMRGYPLPKIISRRLRWQPNKEPRKVIRETLELIEEDIRFRVVRVFTTYNSLLTLAYNENGMTSGAASLEAIPLFLELGASDRTMISFMELGVSRPLAVELARKTQRRDFDQDEALHWLREVDSLGLGLSETMLSEFRRTLERYQGWAGAGG